MAHSISASQVTRPLAVSAGEPAGVGCEIILKAWLERWSQKVPAFAVFGDVENLESQAQAMGLSVEMKACAINEVISVFEDALPVVQLSGKFKAKAGQSDYLDGPLVIESISSSVNAVIDGHCSALVTAPINKKALYDCGFDFPGHTEYLAHLTNATSDHPVHPVMMLAGPELRTVPVTIHIPLDDVASTLTTALIVKTVETVANDLKCRFSILEPAIAVAGLNPHAGEDGTMGREDIEVIQPAIDILNKAGIAAIGPLPADTLFHKAARQNHDAVVCMYHDQALIPAKTLAFDEAVNVTLGLPFIRTSPDHGTAYNIAGKGIANPTSFIAALKLAHQMAQCEGRAS